MDERNTPVTLRPGITVRQWGDWDRVCRDGKIIVDLPPGKAAELFDLPALHRAGKCGAPTVRQGKARYCERQAGHAGRHWSTLGGRDIYWKEA